MRNFTKIAVAIGLFLSAQPSEAECPTLSSELLGKVLCPGVGLASKWTINSVEYTRKADIKGIGANFCSFISKTSRDDGKTYAGEEEVVQEGNLVCHYHLPENWRSSPDNTEFTMTTTIKTAPSVWGALCPKLNYDDLSSALCGTEFKIGNVTWSIETKGTVDSICKFGQGIKAAITGAVSNKPKGNIYGVIGDESTQFKHNCTYNYHRGDKPASVTLNGKINLKELKEGSISIGKGSKVGLERVKEGNRNIKRYAE